MADTRQVKVLAYSVGTKQTLDTLLSAARQLPELTMERTGDPAQFQSDLEENRYDAYCVEINKDNYPVLEKIAATPQLVWPQLLLWGQEPTFLDDLTRVVLELTPPGLWEFRIPKNIMHPLELHANLHAQYEVHYEEVQKPVQIIPGIESDSICGPGFESHLQQIMEKARIDRTHPLFAMLDPGQYVSLSHDMLRKARDMEAVARGPGYFSSPNNAADRLLMSQSRKFHRLATLLMRKAFENKSVPPHAGKQTMDTHAVEGGGIHFRNQFVKRCDKRTANLLASMYMRLRQSCPALNVPAPDAHLNEYPTIKLDDQHVAFSMEYAHGSTVQQLLQARPNILKAVECSTLPGIVPEYVQLSDIFFTRLRHKMLHDLALFEKAAITRGLCGLMTSYEEPAKQAKDAAHNYLQRTVNAAQHLSPDGDHATFTKAAKAMLPEDDTGHAISADGKLVRLHRDSNTANFIVRGVDTDGPLDLSFGILGFLTKLQGDLDFASKIYAQAKIAASPNKEQTSIYAEAALAFCPLHEGIPLIDNFLERNLVNIDFGRRLALLGEDFYQLMMDPDWRFDMTAPEQRSLEDTCTLNLCRYLMYQQAIPDTLQSVFLNPTGDLNLFHHIYTFSEIPPGDRIPVSTEATYDWTTDHLDSIPLRNLPYHFDWMWYCRAMRDADVALTLHSKKMADEKVASLVSHYVRCSAMPLERMRIRYHDEMKGVLPDFVPAEGLDAQRVFASFEEANGQADTPQQRADLHMLRLDYLAAFTKMLQEKYTGGV